MKVSLSLIKGLVGFDLPPADELAERIGAQLGGIEDIIDVGSKYDGALIVKVVACEKHPDADKLSLCKIDDGKVVKDVERDSDGLVQVVCGAPNVHTGMLAIWLPPGVTVPETADKEPFILSAREIRGKVSNGMLASPKELAFGDSHAGIMEVDGDFTPGTELGLKGEMVLDIENKMFTHRPDCFGMLGIAREVAGILNKPFKSPDWYVVNPEFSSAEADDLALAVKNELAELVSRFTAITMSDIKIGPSPLWLQMSLASLGQKSINNIVDYTNWFMLLTGQPLHAYDYDKVKALSGGKATIVVRNPKPGEKLTLLNGKTVEPRAEAIMIATDKQLIGIGGVMGGRETEVDENTKNIILECASFDMYSVRRTSMEHGLFTDAVTRFTKGQSPLQNLAVLNRIVNEIVNEKVGQVAGAVVDDNHIDAKVLERGSVHPPVSVSTDFINDRLGLKLSGEEIKKLLENVEFKIEIKDEELTIAAPYWRTDIELREDVVEEIGRLYGYDKLPLELPKRNLSPAARDPRLSLKAEIRNRLSKAGANEVLTYSFVHGKLLDKVGQEKANAYQVANALSPDLQYYRLSLMPSLLEKVHSNIKAGYDQFALFELGKAHIVGQNGSDGLPREDDLTALVVTADDKLKKAGSAFYLAKRYVRNLTGLDLSYKPVPAAMQAFDITKPYDMNRAAFIYAGDDFLGIIGEFRPSVKRALKLPQYSAGFELDTTALLTIIDKPLYTSLSRFPWVVQDISLKVSAGLAFDDLFNDIFHCLDKTKPDSSIFTLRPLDIYQDEKDSVNKHITLRLQIADYDRTLTDAEVNKLLDEVANAAKEKFGAERL